MSGPVSWGQEPTGPQAALPSRVAPTDPSVLECSEWAGGGVRASAHWGALRCGNGREQGARSPNNIVPKGLQPRSLPFIYS